MIVWLQLSYGWALPLKYWLAQLHSMAQYADYKSKTNYIMYRYFSAHAKKRVAGWNRWCNGLGKMRQCKGAQIWSKLYSSVRATPMNILKQALCRPLQEIQGHLRWDWWGWSWSGMIRNGRGWLVEIGASHQIRWNILREHNWGVPSAHICWNLFPSPRLKVMWSITWLVSVSPGRSAYPKVVRAHSNYVYKTCSMHQYELVPLPPNFHNSSYFKPTNRKSECPYYLPLCTVGASSTGYGPWCQQRRRLSSALMAAAKD